jgi:hypothetical protein
LKINNAASGDTEVSLEKQRLVVSVAGIPELRPTGPNYFEVDPQPIKVSAGEKKGHVRTNFSEKRTLWQNGGNLASVFRRDCSLAPSSDS